MAKAMRKIRVGSVVGTRMDKTAVVELVWKQRHRIYRKQMRRVTRFYVHDPDSRCEIGDTVRIQETRPISRTKHWRTCGPSNWKPTLLSNPLLVTRTTSAIRSAQTTRTHK